MPIFELLNILHRLYDDGADYVDLVSQEGELKDTLSLIVKDEYLSQEEPKKLTDEDLNQLI